MWFGKTQVTVVGMIPGSGQQVLGRLRERLLGLGGSLETEGGDTIIGVAQAHRVLGKSYLFGTWYGNVPFRLRLRATSEAQGGKTRVQLDCDLTAILTRFRYVFAGLSAVVILPIAIKGWRQDPSLLLLLPLPYIICLVNFLSLRLVLPQRLRRAFQVEGVWWES